MIRKNILKWFLLGVMLLPVSANSLEINSPVTVSGIAINPVEFTKLPEYLQAKVKFHYQHGEPIYVKWHNRFGVDYQHFHHWAAAIVKYERALNVQIKNRREFAFGEVVNEYDYLLRSCTPNFELRYLFHYGKGKALLAKGDYPAAAREFTSSIKLNKDYIYSYLSLSEAYTMAGMQSDASKVMEQARKIIDEKNNKN
jgi:tetratricopeptide (TPR) repeat protein